MLTPGSDPLMRVGKKGLIMAKPDGLLQVLLGGGIVPSMGVLHGASRISKSYR